MPEKITYKVSGKLYDIEPNQSDEFLSEFPDAVKTSAYKVGDKVYDISDDEYSDFLSEFPDAKQLKKKDGTVASSDIKSLSQLQGEYKEPISEPMGNRDVDLNPFFRKEETIKQASDRASKKLKNQMKHVPMEEDWVFVDDVADIPDNILKQSLAYNSATIVDNTPKEGEGVVKDGSWSALKEILPQQEQDRLSSEPLKQPKPPLEDSPRLIQKESIQPITPLQGGTQEDMQSFVQQNSNEPIAQSQPIKDIEPREISNMDNDLVMSDPLSVDIDEDGNLRGFWVKESNPDWANKVKTKDYITSKAAASSVIAKGFLYANAAILSTRPSNLEYNKDEKKKYFGEVKRDNVRETAIGFIDELHKDMSNYANPSLAADLTGTVLGFVADAPIFSLGGAVGSSTLKGIGIAGSTVEKKLIQAGVKKSVASNAVKAQIANKAAAHTGGALGVHRFLGDLTEQYGDSSVEDISFSEAFKGGLIGTATGMSLGYWGAYINSVANGTASNYVTKNIKNGTLNSSTLQNANTLSAYTKGAGFVGEVGLFELAHVMENGTDDWSVRGLIENASFLGLLKGHSTVALRVNAMAKAVKDGVSPKSTKDLTDVGRDVITKMTERALPELKIPYTDADLMEIGQTSAKDLTERMILDRKGYIDILNNPDISLETKQKLMYNTDGVILSKMPRPARIDIDENGLKLYSKDGEYLSSMSRDDAMGAFGKIAIHAQKVVDMYNGLDRLANKSTPEELAEVDRALRKMGYEDGVENPIFKEVLLNTGELSPEHHKAIDNFDFVIKKEVSLKEGELKPGDKIEFEGGDGKRIKGNVKKTQDGITIKDDLMGEVEFKETAEIDVLRDKTNKELEDIDVELSKRRSVSEDAEYVIGSETFKTKEEFIARIEEIIKNENIDALVLTDSDYIRAKDMSFNEIFEVANKTQANIQGIQDIKNKFKSNEELVAAQEMLEYRLDRANIAEGILDGTVKLELGGTTDVKSEANNTLKDKLKSSSNIETKQAQKPTSEAPETTISPETTQSATQGKKGSETAKTEDSSKGKLKVRKAASIIDAETGQVFYVRDVKGDISIETSKEVTNKAVELKRLELETKANEELATERQKIIDEIKGIDAEVRNEGYVDVGIDGKVNRYKVLEAPSGGKTVMSYTQRTTKGRQKKVTNEKIKDQVLKEWDRQSAELSDAEMRVYEERVRAARDEIMDKVEVELTDYQAQRAEMLTKEGKPIFKESGEVKAKQTDKQQGIKERNELPSEQDKTANKKVVDIWSQFKRELKIAETSSKRGAKAKAKDIENKATALTDMIKENKDILKIMSTSVHTSLLNRIATGGLTEAKFNNTVKYVEKVLTDAAFRTEEAARLKELDKINKVVSDKALYIKGNKKKAKASLKDGTGDTTTIEKLDFIGSLVNTVKGKTAEKTKEKLAQREKRREIARENIAKNEAELDLITEKALSDGGSLTEADLNNYFKLQAQNEVLDFANIDSKTVEQTKEMRERVESWRDGQRTKSELERQERMDRVGLNVKKTIDIVTGDGNVLEAHQALDVKGRVSGGFFSNNSWKDSSFYSVLNKLAKKDKGKSTLDQDTFNDRLNEMFALDVRTAERSMEKMRVDFAESHLKESHKIFKTKNDRELDRALMRAETGKDTKVELFNSDGTVESTLNNNSEMQLAAKLLQWRDPVGRANLSVPRDKPMNKDQKKGMGYTEKTIEQIEKYLSPEVKAYAEYVYDQINNVFSKQYDEAYKREYGVSMLTDQDGYFPLYKESKAKDATIDDISKNSGIQTNRTMKRTGQKGTLAYNSLQDMLVDYVNEASRFIAWSEPLREMQYVFKNPNVRRAIRQEHGQIGVSSIDHFMDVFSGKNDKVTFDTLDKAMRNMGVGILGLKFMPAIKQTLSSGYYLLGVSPKNTARFGANMTRMISLSDPTSRALNKYLLAHPLLKSRRSHAIDVTTGQSHTRATVRKMGTPGFVNKAKTYIPIREITDVAGAPLKYGDRMPIVKAGGAYIMDRYQKYTGKPLTESVVKGAIEGKPDFAFKMAMEDWDLISTLTQQSMSESNISYTRRMSSWGKGLNAFTSGPAQIHRIAMSNVREMNKAIKAGDGFRFEKAMRRFLITHAVSGIMFEFAAQTFNIPDGDDKKSLAMSAVIGNAAGYAYWGRAIALVKDLANEEFWAEDGLSMSPVFENMSDAVVNSYKIANEYWGSENPDYDEMAAYGKRASLAYAALLGFPVDGTIKVVMGNVKNIKDVDTDFATGYDKLLRSVGVGVGDAHPNPIYVHENGKLDYRKALKEADGTISAYKGVLKVDENALINVAKWCVSSNLDPNPIIAKAISDEVKKIMQAKINKAGYGYQDRNDMEGIMSILENVDDLTPGEVNSLWDKYVSLAKRNPELDVLKAEGTITKMFMNAEYGLGYPVEYTNKKQKK